MGNLNRNGSLGTSIGIDHGFGGGGGGFNSATSNSMIGGGLAPLTDPGGAFSAGVTISAPLDLTLQRAATSSRTALSNKYEQTSFSVVGLQIKVLGLGAGIDFYYDRNASFSFELDVSAIFGGTLTLNRNGFTPNGYASLNTGAGVGFVGMGVGGGVGAAYDEGVASAGGHLDLGLVGLSAQVQSNGQTPLANNGRGDAITNPEIATRINPAYCDDEWP
jgi:hypothetical protein